MKDPQIISIAGENPDLYMMVWGGYVIDDTTQVAITATPIDVRLDFFDVTDGSTAIIRNASLVYDTGSQFWRVAFTSGTPTIVSELVDRHKYVCRISEEGSTANMREFYLEEFAVDNGSFEETLMRLPFQVEIGGSESWIVWYDSIDPIGTPKFKAEAYQGSEGVVYATEAAKVTHRGPIIPY